MSELDHRISIEEEVKKRAGLWASAIFSIIGLAFFFLSGYVVYAIQDGRFDLADQVLMPVSALMFLVSLVSFFLIRSSRLNLGNRLLFSALLLPPIAAALLLEGFGIISVVFIVILSPIMIARVIPNYLRTWATVLSLIAVVTTIVIELWNPEFRVSSSIVPGFANFVIAFAFIGLLVLLVRSDLLFTNEEDVDTETLKRRSTRISVVLLVANASAVLFNLVIVFQVIAWQLLLLTICLALFEVAMFFGYRKIRAGEVERGGWIIIWSMVFAFLPGSLLVAQVGLVLGIATSILTFVVASQTMPSVKVQRAAMVGIVSGFLAVLINQVNVSFRIVVPSIQTFVPILAVLIVLVSSIFIFRRALTGTIRVKVFAVLIAVVLVLTAGLITPNILGNQEEAERDEINNLNRVYTDYNDDVELLESGAAMLSISLSDRDDIKELFLADDRDGLLALLTPLFDEIQMNYDIRHLYVIDADGVVYVRVHNPAKFGDDVTYRRTAESALRTQTTAAGVEIGPSRLGIRSVSPLFHQGRFIGMVEVGLDYDQAFIEDIKAHTGADFVMWVTNEAAAPAGLGPEAGAKDAPIPELFFYASTFQQELLVDIEAYYRVLAGVEPEVQYVETDGESKAVLLAPMLGYGNRLIGVIEIIQDRSETLARIQSDLRNNLVTAVGGLVIGLVAVWFSIQSFILRPLDNLTETTQKQLAGDTTARVQLDTRDEFGQLGTVFNDLSDQLASTILNQEETIAERTRSLQISNEVSRRLSTILDQRDLIREVVEQVQSSFDYYHAQIYLFDNAKENLVMMGGTGQAGRAMLDQDHTIPTGKGLVGRAGAENIQVLVSDTSRAEGWLPNPLLPETKAEVAIPIAIGENVVGVLDVQDNEVGGLTQDDADLLQSIANQVAIALQNTRAYRDAQRRADREALIGQISSQIQTTTTVGEALQVTVRELGRVIGTDTSIKLKTAGSNDRGK